MKFRGLGLTLVVLSGVAVFSAPAFAQGTAYDLTLKNNTTNKPAPEVYQPPATPKSPATPAPKPAAKPPAPKTP